MANKCLIRKVIEKIKAWYKGEYIPPPENDPESGIFIILPGYYKKPLLAKFFEVIGHFFIKNWQWAIGIAVAVIGILVTL